MYAQLLILIALIIALLACTTEAWFYGLGGWSVDLIERFDQFMVLSSTRAILGDMASDGDIHTWVSAFLSMAAVKYLQTSFH